MSIEDTHNVNARRLLNCVKSMLDLSSMNFAMWIQARDTPTQFIQFVEENLCEIQKEFEGHFKMTAVYPRFLRQNARDDGRGNFMTDMIGWIKMIRTLTNTSGSLDYTKANGWGLADAKNFVEKLPNNGDFRFFYFHSVGEATASTFGKTCRYLCLDIEWVPIDNTDGLRHYDDHPHKLQ